MNDKQIIKKLTEELEEATKPKWVSVHDMTPDKGVCVDLYLSYGDSEGRICNCFLDSENDEYWYWDDKVEARIRFDASLVTHWMPLPEPPKQ